MKAFNSFGGLNASVLDFQSIMVRRIGGEGAVAGYGQELGGQVRSQGDTMSRGPYRRCADSSKYGEQRRSVVEEEVGIS